MPINPWSLIGHGLHFLSDNFFQSCVQGYVHAIPDRFRAGYCFCSDITVILARFLWRREAASRRSLKWRVTYRKGIHTIAKSLRWRHEKLSALVWTYPKKNTSVALIYVTKLPSLTYNWKMLKKFRGFNKHRHPKKLVGYFAQRSRLPFFSRKKKQLVWITS